MFDKMGKAMSNILIVNVTLHSLLQTLVPEDLNTVCRSGGCFYCKA